MPLVRIAKPVNAPKIKADRLVVSASSCRKASIANTKSAVSKASVSASPLSRARYSLPARVSNTNAAIRVLVRTASSAIIAAVASSEASRRLIVEMPSNFTATAVNQ